FGGTGKYSLTLEELKVELARGKYPIVYLETILAVGQRAQCHAVVVASINNDEVHLHDPARGRIIYTLERFTREWRRFHEMAIIIE
ncbi:MAG TPA: cysteine peptidase family C39 domain-containing protein, partial [Blastocatellia bacterium]|nr:cysteine peptidase family C39 domain-containing protein [Blastocatellia bacterium]